MELHPVGHKVLFESDDIKVWLIQLEPGGHLPLHKHENPYLVVSITDSEVRVEDVSGEVLKSHVKPGEVVWHPVGETHDLTNPGAEPYMNVLIEVKQRGSRP
jgi:beta-alanine degradation protein BauB